MYRLYRGTLSTLQLNNSITTKQHYYKKNKKQKKQKTKNKKTVKQPIFFE